MLRRWIKMAKGKKWDAKGLVFYGVIFLLVLLMIVILNKGQRVELMNRSGSAFETAKVLQIYDENIVEVDGYESGTQEVQLEILTGSLKGQVIDTTNYLSYLSGAYCEVGKRVIVTTSESMETLIVTVYGNNRAPVLYAFILVFLAALSFVGGKKGIKAALALVFTFICIIFIYIPMIYQGFSPFGAAVLVVILTTLITLSFMNGFEDKSIAAMAGTIIGVILAGLTAAIVSKLARVSGYNMSDAEELVVVADQTKMQVGDILFSAILIASLGAVMDVAMSIASSIKEIKEKNPELERMELFRAGMNIGKDMMGTMSNTLILAFTGGSISSLLLVYSYQVPYKQLINTYTIAIEIIKGLSGSLALILTVPIVSLISAWMVNHKKGKS